ncbi:hypothetical protein [Desulfosarcina sp.]|uniref:hypothetical protein n=1 Tax=Desulfosarcina sp. TaxID=2027861 RepID=UPI0039706D34
MKKIRFMVAICAALMIAAPAMSLEVDVSGHYFVEHFNHSNETFNKDEATDDYSTMEFMAKPVFKINDNITLTTQFTALQDHVWGTDASGPPSDEAVDNPLAPKQDNVENFDWKAAYMTIKTSIGGFIVGRYIDTPWGTGLGDSTASHGSNSRHKDRVMWVVPTGDFISGLVAQKNGEGDKGNIISDADFHKYYGFSAYKQENWSTGLLIARYEHRNYVNQRDLRNFQTGYNSYLAASSAATVAQGTYAGTYAQALQLAGALNPALVPLVQAAPFNAAQSAALDGALGGAGIPAIDLYGLNSSAITAQGAAAAAGSAISAGPARSELGLWVFNPYFMGTFGPLTAEAEILYGIGEVDLDETRTYQGQTFDSIDASGLAATLDLKYDIAGFTLNAGGTYVQGDSNPDDDETTAIGYFEESIDLEHGFLLTSDYQNLRTTLGGTDEDGIPLGNVSGGPTTITGPAGYTSFWLGAKYQVLDNLKLGLLFVNSTADDVPVTNAGVKWDDDHGSEYDFTVEWDIMNNLKFWGVVAYLDAGDYWKAGGFNTEIEDNTTFYGRLTLEF